MQLPLQLTVRNIALSEVAEADIREKAALLDAYYDQIIGCHVTVDAPHRHQHKGLLYDVRIDMTVPGSELAIRREPNEDIYVAIRDAFDAARWQLEDFARLQRGAVKTHETPPHGRVTQLFPEEGYGFLEASDGREIYFHRNSVLHGGFKNLEIGSEVRFAEEEGEKGPQASTVALVGKHHV
ncbi:MAG TPA: HPF/RaiA family ribosome-associated protein [Candidatus Manganitrophaceae bacterium]|nr:HPF/RaiA family ribosome-associated protein [Candidatus Manganitrophaceae bacterium]